MTVLKYILVVIIILSVVGGLLGGLFVICAGFLNRNEEWYYLESETETENENLKGNENNE